MNSSIGRLTVLAFACLSALVLAACGGDDAPSTGPDEVTKSFLVALAEGDSAAACELISSASIEQEDVDCEDAVGGAVEQAGGEADVQAVEDASYEVDEESDDAATVTVSREDGQSQTFQLINEDGEWKVSG